MTDGYGEKINNAVKAVQQMHVDTSKLLQACDDTIGKGKESLYPNRVTHGISNHLKPPSEVWMARGVYRYYKPRQHERTANQPGLVEGVTVVFIPDEPVDKPLFIVGQLDYKVEHGDRGRDTWDLWYGFFDWSTTRALNEVTCPSPDDHNRIKSMKLIAVSLYQIKDINHVQELMTQVQQAP